MNTNTCAIECNHINKLHHLIICYVLFRIQLKCNTYRNNTPKENIVSMPNGFLFVYLQYTSCISFRSDCWVYYYYYGFFSLLLLFQLDSISFSEWMVRKLYTSLYCNYMFYDICYAFFCLPVVLFVKIVFMFGSSSFSSHSVQNAFSFTLHSNTKFW